MSRKLATKEPPVAKIRSHGPGSLAAMAYLDHSTGRLSNGQGARPVRPSQLGCDSGLRWRSVPRCDAAFRGKSSPGATGTGGCAWRGAGTGHHDDAGDASGTIRANDQEPERAARTGWLMTLDGMSQPTQCAYIGAGEGTLRSPRPLAARRVLPALPVGVRLVAGPQHRVAVVEHGTGTAALVRRTATTERCFVRREWRARFFGWPARAIPHGRSPLSPGGPKRTRRTRASGLTAAGDRALPRPGTPRNGAASRRISSVQGSRGAEPLASPLCTQGVCWLLTYNGCQEPAFRSDLAPVHRSVLH